MQRTTQLRAQRAPETSCDSKLPLKVRATPWTCCSFFTLSIYQETLNYWPLALRMALSVLDPVVAAKECRAILLLPILASPYFVAACRNNLKIDRRFCRINISHADFVICGT